MTTNKPRAGEAIVKIVQGPLGEKLFIATDSFWKYLDELDEDSADATEEPVVTSPAFGMIDGRLRSLESGQISNVFSLSSRIKRLESQPVAPTHRKVKELENDFMPTGDTTYTTTGDLFLTCLNTASATVTLNTKPYDGEDAIIWRADGFITVNGDINGGTSISILSKFDTAHLKFSLAANKWAIV